MSGSAEQTGEVPRLCSASNFFMYEFFLPCVGTFYSALYCSMELGHLSESVRRKVRRNFALGTIPLIIARFIGLEIVLSSAIRSQVPHPVDSAILFAVIGSGIAFFFLLHIALAAESLFREPPSDSDERRTLRTPWAEL